MKQQILDWMYNPMVAYTALALSQVGNSWFRSWNIKSVSNHNHWNARISWFLYGVAFLTSITLGVRSMSELDGVGISIWFIGSMIGQEIGMIRR